jgi:hypothetical protein
LVGHIASHPKTRNRLCDTLFFCAAKERLTRPVHSREQAQEREPEGRWRRAPTPHHYCRRAWSAVTGGCPRGNRC